MNLICFFKERVLLIIMDIFITSIIYLLFSKLKVSTYAIVLALFSFNILIFLIFFLDYKRSNNFIRELEDSIDNLDEKYLLSEIISKPDSIENKRIYNVLCECNKSMNDKISELEKQNSDYREFIELWVHEVKTPIASSKLIIENHRDEILDSIDEELKKIEEYIEKVLFYARSSSVEKDFIVEELNLEQIVNASLRKNSIYLIEKSVSIEKVNLNHKIYTDRKWLSFIINQIVSNSIKYFDKEKSVLRFIAEEREHAIVFSIVDNGQGMDEKSELKAFDKGFTGVTGRQCKEATGIGLYLSKKLALKLGLNIYLSSNLGEGTKVSIVLPQNGMTIFND